MWKIQIAISSDLCIRLTWNLTGSCGQQQRLRGWSRMVVKQFPDGGRPPFWKSFYSHISVKNHPTFMKFCTQQQILNWMNVTWSKMRKLHWQTPSSRERISCYVCILFIFLTYLASNNGVTLKSGWEAVYGHWKWRRSINYTLYTTYYWSATINSYTIFEWFDVE